MAPEVLKSNSYSKEADVYAWGIILHELYTKKYPFSDTPEYANAHITHLTYQIANNGLRPDCSSLHPALKQLVLDCWNLDPKLRPTFSEIIARLKRIKKMKIQISDDEDGDGYPMYNLVNSPITSSERVPLLMDNSTDSNISSHNTTKSDIVLEKKDEEEKEEEEEEEEEEEYNLSNSN